MFCFVSGEAAKYRSNDKKGNLQRDPGSWFVHLNNVLSDHKLKLELKIEANL